MSEFSWRMGVPGSPLVAFDLETTGLSARADQIIEVGAVKFSQEGVIDTWSTLVDPRQPVPLVVQRLCGIHDRDLVGQPSPAEAVASLALFSQDCTLVGHGVAFDLAFCAEVLPEAFRNRPALDTSELARVLLPRAPSHSLEELSRSLELVHDRPHRALSDAIATSLLLESLVEGALALPAALRQRIRRLCLGAGWPSGEYLGGRLAAAPEDAIAAPEPSPPRSSPPPVSAPVFPRGGVNEAWVRQAFGATGELARADPDFELREEQQQMALAVGQAFNRGGRLLVEAGTGVGKSLAYLIPAREWAAGRGQRVVVSTYTITLQEQLMSHDLPAAQRARPLPLRAAVLKGRGNYLSLRRLERWLARPDHPRDLDQLRFKLRLLVWAHETETGDRGELRLAGPDRELWEKVASTVDDCLGPACHNWRDGRCFMVRARMEARGADIVVVNHALLLADADSGGAVLPEFHHLVVDEAHHLEEAATQAQSRRLGATSILAVAERIPDLGDPDLDRALKALRQLAPSGFADLRHLLAEAGSAGTAPAHGPLVLDGRLGVRPEWQPARRSLRRLARALAEAVERLRQAAETGQVQTELWPQPENGARECWMAADALRGMAASLGQALAAAEPDAEPGVEDERVNWLEVEGGDRAVLRSAPAGVAAALHQRLFANCETVVLTSATLAVAGSFRYIKGRLGLEDAEELVLDSPFDFLSQSLCCVPRGMPGHGDPAHPRTVAGLVADIAVELGGRTMVLFTGYQALREVHGLLRALLANQGIAILGQGLDGTRNQVLRNFRRNPRSVLLGTSSFWEGIDLPGPALQCVVIDKLPFPVPSDPIFQARARGTSDSFAEISLPEAVLRLKQGFGRLVRSHGDRGAVVICDPRILERDYGDDFVRALPRATFSYEPPSEVAPTLGAFLKPEVPAPSWR